MSRRELVFLEGSIVDVPWQQLFDAVDGMLGNALEHMAQIGLRIETVELGCPDQRVDRRRSLAALVRAGKQVVLAVMRSFA